MPKYCKIGTVIAPHGLEGKVKIISLENNKDKIFKENNSVYIANKEYIINSYQKNNKYDILSFKNYLHIDLIKDLIKKDVYVDLLKLDLEADEYLINELKGATLMEEGKLGVVVDIIKGKIYPYLLVKNTKEYLVPLIKEFVIEYKREEQVIITKNVKELSNL